MKPAVRQKALLFISKHPGTRHKAFPAGHAYHFDAPELGRAPFRASTINQLIAEGFVTDKGPVTLTAKGEHELHKPPNLSPAVKGRVIYSMIRQGTRRNFSLQATLLNGSGLEVHGAKFYPTYADIVAHIRNMPKRDKQRVLRELIKDLAEQATKRSEDVRAEE